MCSGRPSTKIEVAQNCHLVVFLCRGRSLIQLEVAQYCAHTFGILLSTLLTSFLLGDNAMIVFLEEVFGVDCDQIGEKEVRLFFCFPIGVARKYSGPF